MAVLLADSAATLSVVTLLCPTIVSLLLVQEAIAEEQQRQQPQASIGAH